MFGILPEAASTMAGRVDQLFWVMVGLSVFFTVLVVALIFLFTVRYRRRTETEIPAPMKGAMQLEVAWTVIPLILAMGVFVWAARLYVEMSVPPKNALEIFIVGKQWMWKAIHSDGQEEINTLHVPVRTPVKLTMTSEDVIHSYFIPAFRIKQDTVPGRYTQMWFEATETGDFHLFCAEYCGTDHSKMIGRIYVLSQDEYQSWLATARPGSQAGQAATAGGGGVTTAAGAAQQQPGEALLESKGCNSCHRLAGGGIGPSLAGIYGKPAPLQDGSTVTADDAYLRESILNPQAKIVQGYQPVMPSYQGQLSEEQITQIINYIKSLGAGR